MREGEEPLRETWVEEMMSLLRVEMGMRECESMEDDFGNDVDDRRENVLRERESEGTSRQSASDGDVASGVMEILSAEIREFFDNEVTASVRETEKVIEIIEIDEIETVDNPPCGRLRMLTTEHNPCIGAIETFSGLSNDTGVPRVIPRLTCDGYGTNDEMMDVEWLLETTRTKSNVYDHHQRHLTRNRLLSRTRDGTILTSIFRSTGAAVK